jgi:hypothetical protein
MEGDKSDDPTMSAAPDVGNMEVDGHPSDGSGKTAAPFFGAHIALTPFNHSPVTPRWKEIVDRARASSPSRVHSFMQGHTRPGPVLVDVSPRASRPCTPPSPPTPVAGSQLPGGIGPLLAARTTTTPPARGACDAQGLMDGPAPISGQSRPTSPTAAPPRAEVGSALSGASRPREEATPASST